MNVNERTDRSGRELLMSSDGTSNRCFCSHSISAQSNFAVGAVVNATFGSITEMTFYITALLRGHKAATKCYEEIVKAALTGTLLGCILFIPVRGGGNGHSAAL